jgi:transcriptional regulator with XRE-family HTH domain
MSDSEEFIFNDQYCGRVKRFREETNMSAAEMAELLDIPADRYRKYETRSPLPAYLIAKFCRIVGCDLEHLILGKPRERLKPVMVARKTTIAEAQEQADLARRAEDIESTPGGPGKLDKFVQSLERQRNTRRKMGT